MFEVSASLSENSLFEVGKRSLPSITSVSCSVFTFFLRMRGSSILVLYHHPCADGAFSALAAKLSSEGDRMVFIPHSTSSHLELDTLPEASQVYLLDYCGPRGLMESLCKRYPSVILIDHHRTADIEVTRMIGSPEGQPDNLQVHIDNSVAGCIATYRYLKVEKDTVLPLFAYVQDNDLWKHELPNSKAFTAGLSHLNLSFDFAKYPSEFDILMTLVPEKVIEIGKDQLVQQALYIKNALESSFEATLGPFDQCRIYEASSYMPGISELGHQLALLSPAGVGVVATIDAAASVKISARSVGSVDTTAFTSIYGGGGHLNSSGCVISREEWERIKYISN